jgi:hypothetical protein
MIFDSRFAVASGRRPRSSCDAARIIHQSKTSTKKSATTAVALAKFSASKSCGTAPPRFECFDPFYGYERALRQFLNAQLGRLSRRPHENPMFKKAVADRFRQFVGIVGHLCALFCTTPSTGRTTRPRSSVSPEKIVNVISASDLSLLQAHGEAIRLLAAGSSLYNDLLGFLRGYTVPVSEVLHFVLLFGGDAHAVLRANVVFVVCHSFSLRMPHKLNAET